MNLNPKNNPARSAHGTSAGDVVYPYTSWAQVMQHHQLQYGEKRWLTFVDADDSRIHWTYHDFIDTARRLATVLGGLNVERGDRVGIAGHNHPDTILLYFACWLKGACAVPLNMSEDDNRLKYIVENSNCNTLFTRSEYMERMQKVMEFSDAKLRTVEVDSEKQDSAFYQGINDSEAIDLSTLPSDMLWDECLIVYTSGTTGNPKGVVLIQQNLFADGYDIAKWHGIDSNQCMMCVLPVHHVNGTIVTHVAPFLVGARVVLHRKFSVSRFWTSVVSDEVNVVSVVPTLLAFLLEVDADEQTAREKGFRHIICGAGPLTCSLAKRFETRYGFPIVHGYGLSETTCYTCFLPVDMTPEKHAKFMFDYGYPSIGISLPCNEMDIQGPTGTGMRELERGEIVSRGTNVMKEYYANPSANSAAFTNGWFRSGDEGFYVTDEDGVRYYFITGRIKELIIRGGVNLAPLEIDEIINRVPGVKAGICVGFPHDLYGEEVGALVVLDDGNVTEQQILDYCAGYLPFSKQPKVVLFTDTLPVTSTGKYQRNSVKHLFVEFQGVQFEK